MSRLAPIPDDFVMPTAATPLIGQAVIDPPVDAATAARVPVHECGDPLVALPLDLARTVIYDDLPLPRRTEVLVRRGLVEQLRAARASLPHGFDLVVLDAWRSVDFQVALREYYLAAHGEVGTEYVAAPHDSALRAGHTTGGAVDVTLSWNGVPLALGTNYDDFTSWAHPAAFESAGSDERVRDCRRLLFYAMTSAGFAPYPVEWWHWSCGEQWWAVSTGSPRAVYDVVAPASEPLDDERA